MSIIIEKGDSLKTIKEKLEAAEKNTEELNKKEILDLCGTLNNKLNEDPVTLIRKIRDELHSF